MSESDRITRLDGATVERIAAGEVVERPASAVKELVENSIDADADRVDVTVENGGIDGITVTDDGIGMSEADVTAAVREHTTSKIDDIDDLTAGVATLGFRGEALHAIGAVSRLTIRTRPRDDESGGGTELRYEGGEVTGVEPVGCPAGTTVAVDDLFYNVPARRKYLKTPATEFSHVNRVVRHYALANPDVAISLTHDDREVFATTGRGDRRAAIMAIYGREVAESMLPVADDGDGPLGGVSGFVSDPETTRSSAEYVSTFVNGRYVTATAVREAVVDAYGGQLAADRYPFVVLDLDVPGDEVDVNVHPRKMEVRFGNESGVRRQVRQAVRRALLDGDDTSDASDDISASDASDGTDAPDASPDGDTDPVAGRFDGGNAGPAAESGVGDAPSVSDDPAPDDAGDSGDSFDVYDREISAASALGGDDPNRAGSATTGGESDATDGSDDAAADTTGDDEETAAPTGSVDRAFAGPTEQTTLVEGESAGETTERFDRLPGMTLLGQLHGTYLVGATDDGLALIDQHAADERINYERLQAAVAGDATAQRLAEPVELELTAGEREAFESHEAPLSSVGFRAERADDRSIRVTTVPTALSETIDPEVVRDVLSAFIDGERDGEATVSALADDLLADLACHPSITANTSLSTGSAVDLLERLDACENPYACPHGRPTVIEVDRDEIDARFERDYPGHG
ncbi:DNA mismatch repair protein MutL [Halobacteriales archaeon SW_7_68_16]|nr:MAG: DNA mismatch repair protein MutL [Halobacteriales archaeon SW_7_68_16]